MGDVHQLIPRDYVLQGDGDGTPAFGRSEFRQALYPVGEESTFDSIASDNSTAIAAAKAKAVAEGGGTIQLPPGDTGWSGDLSIPARVGMVGWGYGKGVAVSKLVSRSADARFKVGSRGESTHRGPAIGGFDIDGANLATNPLYLGTVVGRLFEQMHIYSGAGDNVIIEEAQNNTFVKVNSSDSGGANWAFDYGAGGNRFFGCDSSAAQGWAVVFRQTAAGGPYSQPQHNVFFHPIIERVVAGVSPGLVDHQAGLNNGFVNPIFAASEATSAISLVRLTQAGAFASGQLRIDNPQFAGEATLAFVSAVEVNAGTSVFLEGLTTTTALLALWNLAGGAASVDELRLSSTTNYAIGSAAEGTVVRRRFRAPIEVTRGAAGDVWNQGLVQGENFARYRQLADRIDFGPGSSTSDVAFQRHAANVGGVGSDDGFRTGKFTVATAPSAANYGDGTQIYFTDLDKPGWSNGTNWKDATGAVIV